MRIGVTGSSTIVHGCQRLELEAELRRLRVEWANTQGEWGQELWLHHGDCIMADEMAAELARRISFKLHGHPPELDGYRAFVKNDKEEQPLPYLERNRALVNSVSRLIALPDTMKERLRSGTWATVRYARKQGKKITIIWPDGTVSRKG